MSSEDPETEREADGKPGNGSATSLVGATLAGRYKVEGLLGEGGMGAVYLVQHTGIRKRLALKVLRDEHMRSPSVVARFEREAMAAAHLDHPNVAAASDYGRTEDGRFYLVLEYVEGKELRALLEQTGPLPLARALFIGRQIVSALTRAFELGIVHRDLKPENIMLIKREGHGDFVKVLDFGLAQVPRRIADEAADVGNPDAGGSIDGKSAQLTRVGDIFGTPAYMAPEQSVGDTTDARTDLYSLGIMLYEMIAGARPFRGKSLLVLMQQHLSMPPPPISETASTVKVPKDVDAMLQRLLAKNPDERFQNPQDLLTEIDRIIAAHKLVWPGEGALIPPAANRSQDSAAGQRIPSIARAWTALRLRPATSLALTRIDDTVTQLRTKLPGRLQRVPKWLIVGGIALVAALPLGLVIRSLLSTEPAITTQPGSRTKVRLPPREENLAPQGALDTAVAGGVDALEALAGRFPADPRIRRALIKSQTAQHRHVAAMQNIAKLAALDPNTGQDLEVVQAIFAALQNDAESTQAAVTLLEQELGEDGVDLIYDLTTKQTGARWKTRLNQSLTRPEVLAKASAATRLAIDLRQAKRCEAKRDLLPRVQREGDRRALTQLKSLTQTQGCGIFDLQDCWPCLRKGTALQEAINAVEARVHAAGGKS